MLHRKVAEATIRQAIGDSASRLPEDWQKWRGDATVSIALPLDHELESGRLYAFLPMGASAVAPLAALVNAPFFPDVDRKDLSLGVPLNAMWLSELAWLAADALAASCQGELRLDPPQQLDLACWTGQGLEQILSNLAAHDLDLDSLPIIPSLNTDACSLNDALIWESGSSVEFIAAAVSEVGAARLVNVDALGPARLDRVSGLANRRNLPLGTSLEDLANMAESVASRLHKRQVPGERWANFYDDLASYAGLDARCSVRTLLITADGELSASDRADGGTVLPLTQPRRGR